MITDQCPQCSRADLGGERSAEPRREEDEEVRAGGAGARAAPPGGRGVHLHEQGHLRIRTRSHGRIQHGEKYTTILTLTRPSYF